jgi:uncharacterized protein (TIGR02301 family)
MMLARRTLIAALLLLTATATPSHAQGVGSALEDNLSRLAEILGALHYLRTVCNGREGNRWRSEMQQLIEAEGASAERKARMTASFNRGYNGYQQTYRVCTPAAEVAVRRYLDEGSKLAREVGARYSN